MLHARTPLEVILDPDLRHSDHGTYDILVHYAFPGNECRASLADLADVLSTDKSQMRRSLTRLEQCGHIGWDRRRSIIKITSPIFAANSAKKQGGDKIEPGAVQCLKCNVWRVTDKMGVCAPCRTDERAELEVAEVLLNSPDAGWEPLWVTLYSNGSTCGRKALKRAYLKLTRRAA